MPTQIYFSDFVAAVNLDDFKLVVLENDEAARIRIRESLDGVELYFHAGPHFENEVIWLTLADLICHRLIRRVTLHKE